MTFTQSFSLNHLPVEIIHRILAHGPCTNALTLSRVSKSLRALSTNPCVYQHIVECGNGVYGDYDDSEEDCAGEWWVRQGFDHEQDWHICAKWALADMKVREIFFRKDEIPHSLESLLSFLPEMISQKHHLALKIAARGDFSAKARCGDVLFDRQPEDSDRGYSDSGLLERLTRTAFIHASGCTMLPMHMKEVEVTATRSNSSIRDGMHYLEWYLPSEFSGAVQNFIHATTKDDLNTSRLLDLFCPPIFVATLGQDLWKLHVFLHSAPRQASRLDKNDSARLWLRCLTFSTTMAGIIHRRLELAIDQHDVPSAQPAGDIPNMRPPSSVDIPLGLGSPVTLPPFDCARHSSDAVPFITRHIAAMTSSDFLTDGEWIGYQSLDITSGIPHWAPMMHGIFFEVTAVKRRRLAVKSGGQDGNGPFELVGTINTARGWVWMTQRHHNLGDFLSLTAVMTPFGIIGAWCDVWVDQGGWFWLWKKEWSERGTVSKLPHNEPV